MSEDRRLWFETQKHLTTLDSALAVLFAVIVDATDVRHSPRATGLFALYLLASLVAAVVGMWATAHIDRGNSFFGAWSLVSLVMFLGALGWFVVYVGFIPIPL